MEITSKYIKKKLTSSETFNENMYFPSSAHWSRDRFSLHLFHDVRTNQHTFLH